MATYNGNTNVLQTTMMQDFLAHLDRNRVFTPWANRKYEGELKRQGQTIDVPVSPSHFVGTSNGDAGGTIPLKNTTISKASLTVEQVEQDRRPISDIEELRTKYSEHSEFLERMAQWLSQQQERHIGVEALRGVAADNDLVATPTSISDGYAVVRAMRKALAKKNVFGGAMFVNPAVADLLVSNANLHDGFSEGLRNRMANWVPGSDGFVTQLSGFKVYQTNNLPFKVSLGMATAPTATDTVVISITDPESGTSSDVTFTFVSTIGTTAGNVLIGANVGESQANLLAAINNPGTTSATQVALSTADQALLTSVRAQLGAWSSDAADLTYTSQGTVAVSETFTDGTDAWGAIGTQLLAYDNEAVNFVDQMSKFQVVSQAANTEAFADILKYESVFQAAVLGRNEDRIAAYSTTTV